MWPLWYLTLGGRERVSFSTPFGLLRPYIYSSKDFLVETFKTHSYERMMPRNPTLFSVCTSFFLLAFLFYFKPCIFSLYLVLQFPDTTKNHAFFYFSKYPKFNLKKWWEKKCFCFLMCNFQCCNFKFHAQGPCAASIVD